MTWGQRKSPQTMFTLKKKKRLGRESIMKGYFNHVWEGTLWAKPQYKESAWLTDGHSKDTEVNVIAKLASQITIESVISCANISISSGSKQVIYLTHNCQLEIWTGIGRCSSGLCSVWWTSARLAYVSRGRVLSPGAGWPGMAFSGTGYRSCMWYLIFQSVWLGLVPRVALQDCKGIGECLRPLEAQAWDWHRSLLMSSMCQRRSRG